MGYKYLSHVDYRFILYKALGEYYELTFDPESNRYITTIGQKHYTSDTMTELAKIIKHYESNLAGISSTPHMPATAIGQLQIEVAQMIRKFLLFKRRRLW